jgi:hypothetical protein
MAGQVAYHLMAQAGMARAPWAVTTLVSCLPVLVLAMGTALAHMLRADAEAPDEPGSGTGPRTVLRSLSWSSKDHDGPDRRRAAAHRDRSARRDQNVPEPGPQDSPGITGSSPRSAQPPLERARSVARELAAAGKPVSRRALRSGGVKGSNQTLNALAHKINAERAERPTACENGDRRTARYCPPVLRSPRPRTGGGRCPAEQVLSLGPRGRRPGAVVSGHQVFGLDLEKGFLPLTG